MPLRRGEGWQNFCKKGVLPKKRGGGHTNFDIKRGASPKEGKTTKKGGGAAGPPTCCAKYKLVQVNWPI